MRHRFRSSDRESILIQTALSGNSRNDFCGISLYSFRKGSFEPLDRFSALVDQYSYRAWTKISLQALQKPLYLIMIASRRHLFIQCVIYCVCGKYDIRRA